MFNRHAPRTKIAALALTLCMGPACVRAAVPMVPAGPPTRLTIVPPRDDSNYEVTVRDAAARLQRCRAPCSLTVASGTANFTLHGDRTQDLSHVLQPLPTQMQLRERNQLSSVMGWVCVGLGAVLTLGSAIASIDAPRESRDALTVGIALGGLSASTGALLSLLAGTNDPQFTQFGVPAR